MVRRVGIWRGDLLPRNNEQGVGSELVDEPLRVAYFDGYPRWEYRFVSRTCWVQRNPSSRSVMLLATDRRYIQEGNVGLAMCRQLQR
ncbi:MAG: hypothetical protein IPJ41_14540 [Phycisphaerales bacterium]|nr:hypothetical protein [Phycisphaerales bacterium]